MNPQTKKLGIAVAIAAAALYGNMLYINKRVEEYKPQKMTKVLIAGKPIPAGTALRQEFIKTATIDSSVAPKVAIRSDDQASYIGQPLRVNVQQGDYILQNYFDEMRSVGNRLSDLVSGGDNFRAVTLPVDNTSSLAGSIVPNDRIDLIFTFNVPQAATKMSLPLLQNVQVLATGTFSPSDQELGETRTYSQRYSTMTLLLSAHDAMRLSYARQVGKVDIMLRNSKDGGAVDIHPIASVQDLLSAQDKEMVAALQRAAVGPQADREQMKEQLKEIFSKQANNGQLPFMTQTQAKK